MLGQKRVPSREGGVEIVVEELAVRMAERGYDVTCINRKGHHVSGKQYDGERIQLYKGIKLKTVPTIDKKGFAAMSASITGAFKAAPACTFTIYLSQSLYLFFPYNSFQI